MSLPRTQFQQDVKRPPGADPTGASIMTMTNEPKSSKNEFVDNNWK
jgi:hypothetical protein